MPSPTSTTCPTFVIVAWSWNPAICSFNRLLISVALTTIVPLQWQVSSGKCQVASGKWQVFWFVLLVTWNLPLATPLRRRGQPCPQTPQLVDDAAVDQA